MRTERLKDREPRRMRHLHERVATDPSVVVRFVDDVALPLLTWIGAALVERWVDVFF